ncbi:hypothetical protein ACFMPD_17400, partial [Sedimentitalea sp. HM32M-2]|uniref:hypothetical protein n=1 Tax=Sedimentitalea sp. HM32M-2 TaxID=3351566 RepID=UPI003630259B
ARPIRGRTRRRWSLPRLSRPDPMRDPLTASGDRDLGGTAPEWGHLFPAGEMVGRDGRQFNLADPSAVMRAFEADAVDAVDLPIGL